LISVKGEQGTLGKRLPRRGKPQEEKEMNSLITILRLLRFFRGNQVPDAWKKGAAGDVEGNLGNSKGEKRSF